jgi:hypothetical protein
MPRFDAPIPRTTPAPGGTSGRYYTRSVQLPDQPHVTIEGTSVPDAPVELPASRRGLHAAAYHGHADGLERAARAVERVIERELLHRGMDGAVADALRAQVDQLRGYAVQEREAAEYLLRRGGPLGDGEGYGGRGVAPYQHVRLAVAR